MTQETIAEKIRQRKASLDAANTERAQLQAIDILWNTGRPAPAPKRIDLLDPTYQITTIGIGNDNTITLLATPDDIQALNNILGKETE